MIRVIIVGIITTALAVAIAITFREDVGLRWFGPDFIVPGAKLPEARLGEEPPAAPVIHVSKKWVTSRGRRVASADEAISDPDPVVDGLYEDLISIDEGLRARRDYGDVSDIGHDIIIQADKDAEFELLVPVLYTCARAGFGRWHLVAVNGETGELEAVTLEQPDPREGVVAGLNGVGVRLIERGDTVAVEYKPIEIMQPRHGYDLILYLGEDWFLLPGRESAVTVGVRDIGDHGYFVLRDELSKVKMRNPEYETLVIACDGCVKYQELIRVLEISVRPEIALKEIYLSRLSRP